MKAVKYAHWISHAFDSNNEHFTLLHGPAYIINTIIRANLSHPVSHPNRGSGSTG